MEIYFDYSKIPSTGGSVITLGNFDGFHLGHQKIVGRTIDTARKLKCRALVITFQPHPRQLFSSDLAVLTPMERKASLLAEAGVDLLLVQPFTRGFAATDPEYFIREVLYSALDCRHVVVGYDYSFGRAGAGDTRLMKAVAGSLGMGCSVVPPVTWDREIISSTVIRRYLAQGDVEVAAKYMGRPFSITGRVEAGAGRGRNLGFPTANIYPCRAVALPAYGVYLVNIKFQQGEYWGLANLGHHPTFPDNRVSLEVHVLNYQGSLYGKVLDVMFHKKLRNEVKFSDADSLIQQVERDLNQVYALLNTDNMLKLQRI